MVDTICLRITNLMSYSWIGKVLDLSMRKEGITVLQVQDVPGDYRNDVANIKEIRYNDTGKRRVLYSNRIQLPSSHYYLAYKIDDLKDCIDFNFSIPKYIYGTNIMQFTPHIQDRKNYYPRSDIEKFEFIEGVTFDKLMSFLDGFLLKLCYKTVENGENVTYAIDKKDVEIQRIDLCFNQYFQSKQDALDYLKYQKRVKKSYIRDTSKNKVDWGSSIFLQSRNYVAKIYHKGKEYESSGGEKKHHDQINKSARREVFPTELLQNEADRILRYEISFKNGYLSRIYKKKVFRKKCPVHSVFKECYKMYKSVEKKCDRLSKQEYQEIEKQPDKSLHHAIKEKFRAARRELRLPLKKDVPGLKKSMITLKGKKDNSITVQNMGIMYGQMLAQNNCFMLEITPEAKLYNRETKGIEFDFRGNIKLHKEAKFSRSLFSEMQAIFRDFIDQFQLSAKLQMDQVGIHVQNYNKHVEAIKDVIPGQKKIYEGPLARISALMENYTIDEMVQLGIISKRTKYDVIERLKKIEFNKASILPKEIKTKVSFEDYQFYRNNMNAFNPAYLV